MDLSIARNVSLTRLRALSRAGLIRSGAENSLAEEWAARLQLKYHRLGDSVGTLSGGNQQKVVLGKWLATGPKVLIVDEPTRGIDVGTKAEVHRLMSELAGQGVAVLMISSELPEVLGMADRVLVMHEGRITGELSRAEANEESVIRLATGAIEAEARVTPPPAATARGRARAPPRRARLPHPRARHRRRARAADRGHRHPRAALRRDRVAAQPRAQRLDLRDPRRRPDARDHHAQRRPVGRLGGRPHRVHGRRHPLQPPRHGAAAGLHPRDGARRGLRPAQRLPHHLGPGAGARGDARHAVRVPRPRVPVDRRAPGQRRDAARPVPEHRHRARSSASPTSC